MGYTNSSLVSYTQISPNKTSPRNHVIDTITIHCLPVDETELLTKNGWVKLRDIKIGDNVAASDNCLNINFEPVQEVVPIRKEDVYIFPTGFMGTAKHRMLMKLQYDISNNKPYKIETVEDIIKRKCSVYIPNSGSYSGTGLNLSFDVINFICAVQADGCYEWNDNHDKIYYIRLRAWKHRKIDAFREILNNLNITYSEKVCYGTPGYESGIEFIIKDKTAIDLCMTYLSDKMFNYNLIEMNDCEATHFAHCLTLWDGFSTEHGNIIERRYTSHKNQNIDVVTAILATHKIGTRLDNKYTLTFKEKECRTLGKPGTYKVIPNVDVSCVSVPSGFILIRQNGRTSIVGNCMAGNLSVETCGNVFASTSRQASSNYGIGSDGRIALYVEEKDRSWCSSNAANDHRAITIEVANDGGAPDWHVSDKAMSALIELVTDICRRNNIRELKWKADKSLIGQVDKQNMTVHRWFTTKECPGNYLYNKHPYIVEEVNKKLGVNISTTELYRVRKTWADASSQIGAYSSLDYAKAACKEGYSIFDSKGNVIYSNNSSTNNSTSAPTTTPTAKTKVTYITHRISDNKWGNEITGYNLTDSMGYSGVIGKSIDKVTIKLDQGTITYSAHRTNGKWGGEITGFSTTDTNNYAGSGGQPIDVITMKAEGIVGTLKYRVHRKADNQWGNWITGYSKTDTNKYAGSIGKEIDAIQIGIE